MLCARSFCDVNINYRWTQANTDFFLFLRFFGTVSLQKPQKNAVKPAKNAICSFHGKITNCWKMAL